MAMIMTLAGILSYDVIPSSAVSKSNEDMKITAAEVTNSKKLNEKPVSLDESRRYKIEEIVQPQSSAASITQEFNNIFFSEQDDYVYLPLTLKSGDIIQATLEGPDNAEIDYNLLLYSLNDGQLGTLVAECGLKTYINECTSKSVADAISYINSSGSNQSYALFVYATTGYSTTEEAKLTISIDENGYYDALEPNDNPFSAVSITADKGVTGCNLNVSNDQDWFV